MLPVLSRLFENLIYDQLYLYLEQGGFLTEQSGFRALHPSTTCLLKCTDDWFSGMDEGLLTGLSSIDFEKPYDAVDHEILCQNSSIMDLWVRNYRGLNLTLAILSN